MMKVMAISDLHGYLPDIPECDLLLLGGDYVEVRDVEISKRFMEGPFTEWLKGIKARYIVAIAGNHDYPLVDDQFAYKLPWIYLKDRKVDIEGVQIYGTPWTPTFGNWAFMKDEYKLKQIFKDIPEGLDILLSHGPAYKRLDRTREGVNAGSRNLLDNIVFSSMPDSVVCGHIHEARGIMDDGATRFYNVSHVNRDIEPVNPATYISLRIG